MAQITWRVTDDADGIIAWIDDEGYPILRQPHHPQQLLVDGKGGWSSVAEAETWVSKKAEDIIEGNANREAEEAKVAAKQEEERQRLINIEAMLIQLTQK